MNFHNRMVFRLIYISFLIVLTCNTKELTASNITKIDSTFNTIERYIQLIQENLSKENDSALILSYKCLDLSKKNDYHKGIIKSYYYLGKIYLLKNNVDSAKAYIENGISYPYIEYNILAKLLWEYTNIMWTAGNYATALENSMKLKELVESGKTNLFKYQIYNMLGLCYSSLLEYDLALEYYNKCLKEADLIQNEEYTGLVYTNIGAIYENKEDYTKALQYLKKGVELEEKYKYYYNASFSYNAIASIYLDHFSIDSSKFYLKKAKELSDISNRDNAIATTYLTYGKYYFKLKDFEKAKEFSIKLIELAQKSKYKSLEKDGFWLLNQTYSELNDYKNAYNSIQSFFKLYTDLYDIKEINKVNSLKQRLILREKENEIFELELKKQKTINGLLYIIIILSVLLIIFAYSYVLHFKRLTNDLKISKQKAEESDKLKSQFLKTISHEIRTPLNGIIGFSDMLVSERIEADELPLINEMIVKNSDDLISTIENLVDIAHLTTNQYSIKKTKFKLITILENIANQIENNVVFKNKKDLQFKLIKEDDTELYADKNIVLKIIYHLVKNAIKYTEKGEIVLGYTINEKDVNIYVKDTGIGISKEKIDLIFTPFRQEESDINIKMGGTGLGLSIVQDLIHIIGGKIQVESELKKGSKFSVSIPKS